MYAVIVLGIGSLAAAIVAVKGRRELSDCLPFIFFALGLFLLASWFGRTQKLQWISGPEYLLFGMLMELAKRYERRR